MNQFIDHSVDFASFEAEILETQNALLAATADLTSPLGELVRAQIKRAYPPIRAAVVLAVAGPAKDAAKDTAEDEASRHKRILLASAMDTGVSKYATIPACKTVSLMHSSILMKMRPNAL